jgi:DNA-binding beta-propeller fold protein YncE
MSESPEPALASRYPRPGDQLAVVSQSGATVTLFDAVDGSARKTLDVTREPHELLFDPRHRVLYCSHTYHSGFYDGNSGRNHLLTVIDPDSARVVDELDLSPEHGPHGLALDPVRRLLYVSVEAGQSRPGGVIVLDADTRRVLRRFDTLAPGPHWFVIDPGGVRGYASNKEAPFVTVVEVPTGTLIDKIEVPGSEGIAVSPDGSTVAVAAPKANLGHLAAEPGVRLIDTQTNVITRTLFTGSAVMPLHWTVDGLLLVGERPAPGADGTPGGGRLSVWRGTSAAGMEEVGAVEVGVSPLTMTSSPDGGRAYVAASVSSTVSVVDLADPARPAVIGTLVVDARADDLGAHGLAYVPAPGVGSPRVPRRPARSPRSVGP